MTLRLQPCPIAAVVFDFDGTLVLSNGIKRQTFFEVVSAIPGGAERMAAVLAAPDPGDRHRIFQRFCEGSAPDSALEAMDLVHRYGSLCEQRILAAPSRAGADALLAVLRGRSIPCFICSATPEEPLRRIVSRRYSEGTFAAVLGAPRSKEDGLSLVLGQQRLPPSALLHVGDGGDDARAAAAVGCCFAAVAGQGLAAGSEGAAAVEDLREVLAWFSFCDLEETAGGADTIGFPEVR